MIPADKARRHIARLASVYGLPADQTAASMKYEAAEVLAAGAKSDAHAAAVCKWLVAKYSNFPAPGTIDSACDAVAVPVKLRAADPKCTRCRGGGWWYSGPCAVDTCPCRTVAS